MTDNSKDKIESLTTEQNSIPDRIPVTYKLNLQDTSITQNTADHVTHSSLGFQKMMC